MTKRLAKKQQSSGLRLNPTNVPMTVIEVDGGGKNVMDLPSFLKVDGKLSAQHQIKIVQQARLMLQEVYVHLPLKRAMHAVDPAQRLRLLEYKLSLSKKRMNERLFHDEMISIFTCLRDLHTVYTLPEPFRSHVAFLPFTLEEFFENQKTKTCKYVAKTPNDVSIGGFASGAIVKSWNGMPIRRAVALNGERCAGGNPDARRARGLETMTQRSMATSPPPDEEWVEIGFQDSNGKMQEIRIPWLVMRIDMPERTAPNNGASIHGLGLDLEGEILRRAKVELLRMAEANLILGGQSKNAGAVSPGKLGRTGNDWEVTRLKDKLKFKRVGQGRKFGYIRIHSFLPPDDMPVATYVTEVKRVVEELRDTRGLIIDVRGNPGGVIMAGERLLQMFTKKPIEPEPLQFVNTALTLRLAKRFADADRWVESIQAAVQTGAAFSQGFPIEAAVESNRIGQIYRRPVLVITDALSYSTTDIFAAGFQDHGIGTILGTAETTGAGGANVCEYSTLRKALPKVFPALPHGVNMRVALRRTTRVREMSGVPLEDLGVKRDEEYKMELDDVLHGNRKLIAHAVKLLQAGSRRAAKRKNPA